MWLLFALLSALAAAMVAIFGKIGLKGIDSNTATAVRALVMAVFLFAVITFEGKLNNLPLIFSNKRALGFIALSGIAGATSWLFYFVALKLGKVSQVAPIDKLSVVFAVIIAAALFGEKVSVVGGIGVALIAAGAVMVALG